MIAPISKSKKKKLRRQAKKKEKQGLCAKCVFVFFSFFFIFSPEKDEEVSSEQLDELPLDAVVKVYANLTDVSYESPWTVEQSEDVVGSGFILVDQKRIITNAHCVANATFTVCFFLFVCLFSFRLFFRL